MSDLEKNSVTTDANKPLVGLEGWLIAVGIYLVLGVISNIFGFFGYLALLGSFPFSSAPMLKILMIICAIVAPIAAVGFGYSLFLFIKKRAQFPKVFSNLLIFMMALNVFGLIATLMIRFDVPAIIGSIIQFAILVALYQYIQKSVRVKNTFVEA